MWPESSEKDRPLRTGLTTGCCATACAVAAAYYLFSEETKSLVSVTLPKGQMVDLTLDAVDATEHGALVSTIKDAGDDPDVTHGAKVFVELSLLAKQEIEFAAASGVGTVTRTGLVLAVGEPAINPVPRQMIQTHLWMLAKKFAYSGGFRVAIGVEKGEQLALKTMNPRLGIKGGLSILGTTGIVRPYSCAAYIASIHQGIDVATSNNHWHMAASTGSTSEAFIAKHYGLPEIALLEMGDFVGAVLKYMKKVPLKKLSLCGGFGKISKLANGALDLHSKRSSINFARFADIAKQLGASDELLEKIAAANTSSEVLTLCAEQQIDITPVVCRDALAVAKSHVPAGVIVEVWAVDRTGKLLCAC